LPGAAQRGQARTLKPKSFVTKAFATANPREIRESGLLFSFRTSLNDALKASVGWAGITWKSLPMRVNKNMQALVTRIKNDLQMKEFVEEKYDRVLDPQTLSQLIKKKI